MIHAQTLKRSTLAVLFSQMLLLGFVVSALSPLANAEASSEQQLYDRILDSIKRLEQQRLEEAVLPGKDKAQDKQKELRQDPDTETLPEVVTRCFPIEHIQIESAGEPAPHLQRWAVKQVQAWQGRCLLLTDIQALQRELNNKLITRGYITSRVLLPEQKIADGELKLLIAAGRVETVIGDGVKARLVELALPSRRGQLLNLRDLEQGVENLSRLPGMSFAFDLQPGAAYGTSKLLAKASWPRQYRASWLASESYYGSTAHGNTQLSFEWGSLFGQPDRLTVGINSDLDREVSDQARGGFFNYDLTLGYWLMAASFNRQRYENQIAGVQKIAANGATDLSQLELKRILYRSPYTRLGLAALGSYADVRNLLDETTIRVSSYRLQSNGLRLDGSQLLGRTQLAASLTYENTKADGPATQVLPGLSVADVNHERWQLYASTQRQFTPLRSALQFKINAQYSDDALFASERFSLASQSSVRAYDDISVSGNNGVAGSLDASITPRIDKLPLKGRMSALLKSLIIRPFLAYDSGVIPGNSNELDFVKLSSATLGTTLIHRKFQLTSQVSWPMEQFSTEAPAHEYTVNAVVLLSY